MSIPSCHYCLTSIALLRLESGEHSCLSRSGQGMLLLAGMDGEADVASDGTNYLLQRGRVLMAGIGARPVLSAGEAGAELYVLELEIRRITGAPGQGQELSEPQKDGREAEHGGVPEGNRPDRVTQAGLLPAAGEIAAHPFAELAGYLDELYHGRYESGELAVFERHVRFLEMLRFLVRQNGEGAAALGVRSAVERSARLMRTRWGEAWTVEMLAEEAGISRYRYTRIFRELTGQNPLDYLNQIRISESKRHLLLSDDRLHAIARRAGFSNEYYFGRRFKQLVGISPGQYRRNHRGPVRIFAPFLEDYLVALGLVPVVQCAHNRWGKQEYLGLQHVPSIDIATDGAEMLARFQPEFMLVEEGFAKWMPFSELQRLAPAYRISGPGEDWRGTLRTVADLVSGREQAEEIILRYEDKVRMARKRLERPAGGRTVACLRISALGVSLYGGAQSGYIGPVLFGDLGLAPHPAIGRLVFNRRKAPLAAEDLAALDADHLFIVFDTRHSTYPGEERAITATPVWRLLPAVRNGCVYEVDFLTWMNYGVISHMRKIEDVLRVLA